MRKFTGIAVLAISLAFATASLAGNTPTQKPDNAKKAEVTLHKTAKTKHHSTKIKSKKKTVSKRKATDLKKGTASTKTPAKAHHTVHHHSKSGVAKTPATK